MCGLCDCGYCHHFEQQEPKQQATLHVMARVDRSNHRDIYCNADYGLHWSVFSTFSQTAQRLVAGEAEALSRHLGFTDVPAGQRQSGSRAVYCMV